LSSCWQRKISLKKFYKFLKWKFLLSQYMNSNKQ
jgi:hypothetical protein